MNFKTISLTLISLFCFLWVAKQILMPLSAYIYFHDDYTQLASKCANAMDESWFVEQSDMKSKDALTTIHLLDCHEYDKTRKLMLAAGLSEHILSYLGLVALEVGQKSADRLVEQHRFTTR